MLSRRSSKACFDLTKTLIEATDNAVACFDRKGAYEGAGQDHVARLQRDAELTEFVGEPCD